MDDGMTTAGRLRVREFAIAATPELDEIQYAYWSESLDLPVTEKGYGVLMCEDSEGKHWTLIGDDPDWVRLLKTAPLDSADVFENIEVPPGMFTRRAEGWPDEW